MSAAATAIALCGAVRPRDGVTTCNRERGHKWEHVQLGTPYHESDGAKITPYLAQWDQKGIETCDHCGSRIDNKSGMCMAPRSVAD